MLVLCRATFNPHFVTIPIIVMRKWTTKETLYVLNIWAPSHEAETCSVLCTSYGGQYDRIRSFISLNVDLILWLVSQLTHLSSCDVVQ